MRSALDPICSTRLSEDFALFFIPSSLLLLHRYDRTKTSFTKFYT